MTIEVLRIAIGVAFALFLGYIYWGTVFRGGSRWYWPLKWLGMLFLYTGIMTTLALVVVELERFAKWGIGVPVLRWVVIVPVVALLCGVIVLGAAQILAGFYLFVELLKWLHREITDDRHSKMKSLVLLLREHIWLPILLALLFIADCLYRCGIIDRR
jgi:hypothetical protein